MCVCALLGKVFPKMRRTSEIQLNLADETLKMGMTSLRCVEIMEKLKKMETA